MYADLYEYIPEKWRFFIDENDLKPIIENLNNETRTICPPKNQIFNALTLCSPENVKIIILGQDPYTDNAKAMGLAFSVPGKTINEIEPAPGVPPSLRNIFRELVREYRLNPGATFSTDLSEWAKQGILMINTHWTTVEKISNAHSAIGWKKITLNIIDKLIHRNMLLILVAWGREALNVYQSIRKEWIPYQFPEIFDMLQDINRHINKRSTKPIHNSGKYKFVYKDPEYNSYLLFSPHPSPLARSGFSGNNHFILINEILKKNDLPPVDWLKVQISDGEEINAETDIIERFTVVERRQK